MKLSKTHTALLADVAAGNVWRSGNRVSGVSTVERPGERVRDVTVPMDALHEAFLVTLAKPGEWTPRNLRRQYRLTAWGERRVAQ